jgi:small-conductance mechanosensitive channel
LTMAEKQVAEAVEAVAEAAHDAAAEAAEAAVEAAEARAEAAEEARDLLAEAALRDEITGHVHALRTEFEACRASHDSRLIGLQTSHENLAASHESLRSELAALTARAPVVVPLSTSAASPVAGAEQEAETVAGAVVIPASAEAAAVVPAAPATARRKGRFL